MDQSTASLFFFFFRWVNFTSYFYGPGCCQSFSKDLCCQPFSLSERRRSSSSVVYSHLYGSECYNILCVLALFWVIEIMLSALFCGSKCWRMTGKDMSKLISHQVKRKFLRFFWQKKTNKQTKQNKNASNALLTNLNQPNQEDICTMGTRKRCIWFSHVPRKGMQLHHKSCSLLNLWRHHRVVGQGQNSRGKQRHLQDTIAWLAQDRTEEAKQAS